MFLKFFMYLLNLVADQGDATNVFTHTGCLHMLEAETGFAKTSSFYFSI